MIGTEEAEALVFVVDDDPFVRDSLCSLFRSVGLSVVSLATAQEFLDADRPDMPSCLVLDVRLPGISGLDFQADLIRKDIDVSIVFITGHGDIPMTVKALKSGAIDFLPKPLHDQELLDAVNAGLARDRQRRQRMTDRGGLQAKLSMLSQREKEVLDGVVSGQMNKQIAAALGVSEITVKVHRGAMMRKMGAKSVADLVRIVASAENLSSRNGALND